MSLIHWNCRGYYANFENLKALIMHQRSPMCIALQETFHGGKTPYPPRGYTIAAAVGRIPPNSTTRPSRGILTLVKQGVPFYQVNLNTNLEATAIRINLGREYTICNIYISPTENFSENNVINLIDQLPRPYIILGDFNARSPSWGDSVTNQHGRKIENLLLRSDTLILNDGGATHFHVQNATESCIDLSLSSPDITNDFEWSVSDDLYGSDHFPVKLHKIDPANINQPIAKYNLDKADWSKFKSSTIVPNCDFNQNLDINRLVERFTNLIITAADASIPKKNSDGNYKYPMPWWCEECREAHRLRKSARRRYKRTKLLVDKIALNRATAISKKTMKTCRREGWRKYVSSINSDTPINKIWKKIKKISGKYRSHSAISLKQNNNVITEPTNVSNILADHYSNTSSNSFYSSEFNVFRERAESKSLNFYSQNDEPYNSSISLIELKSALQKTSDTAPGEDGISYAMLRNLSESGLSFLLFIYNKIFNEDVFPVSWRKSLLIPIHKANKSTLEPSSYRPIALTSSVCKLLEKIINARLVHTLERGKFFSPSQYGFRKGRSTIDSLTNIQSDILNSINSKNHLIAIFFDIQKAYDTTWKYHILKTIYNFGIRGHLAEFIQNFLTHRKIKVKVGSSISNEYDQQQGVPQGSVISCTLFGIAINSIVDNLPQGVQTNLFVDDLAIYFSSASVQTVERKLQLATNQISKWTGETGFRLSPEKTVAVHFHRKRGVQQEPQINLNNTAIKFQPKAKFLGMMLDQRLYFGDHIEYTRQKCLKSLNLLKCLSKSHWGADRQTLLQIYRATTRSQIDYGCQVYASAPNRFLKRLDSIHHLAIRLCTGAFRSSPINSLLTEAFEPPLQSRRHQLIMQHFIRQKRLPNSPSTLKSDLYFNDSRYNELPHSIPFGTMTKGILDLYNLNIPQIIPQLMPSEPPWNMPGNNLCQFKLPKRKIDYPTYVVKNMFKNHQQIFHSDSWHVFTDGSKTEEGTGFGVYSSEESLSVRILRSASVYTAELLAIFFALDRIESSNKTNITIFSDSLSSLQAINNILCSHPIVSKIQSYIVKLKQNGKSIKFCWIPSHVGLDGNEKADELAKLATTNEDVVCRAIPHTDYNPVIKKKIKVRLENNWQNISPDSNKLRTIKSSIRPWNSCFPNKRRLEVVLCRLRIGHTHLTHSHLMSGQADSDCPTCDETRLTVQHILCECPAYDQERRRHFNSTNPNIERLLGENSNLSNLFNFLHSTGIIHRI